MLVCVSASGTLSVPLKVVLQGCTRALCALVVLQKYFGIVIGNISRRKNDLARSCLNIMALEGTVPQKIRYFFESNSYGLKWPWVNFVAFLGSNSTQISIFEVKYLRNPTRTPNHE